MKQTRRFWKALAAVIVAIVTGLLGGMAVQVKEASALNGNYESGQGPTIYYFSDYYPSIGYDTLVEHYGESYQIIYDNQLLSEQSFRSLVESNYFSGFDGETLVIVDLKTIQPEGWVLNMLFSYLKDVEGCKTMFISLYDEDSFDDVQFIDKLDSFIQGDFYRTERFAQLTVAEIYEKLGFLNGANGSLGNVAIFLDNKYIGAYAGCDRNNLYYSSNFFRIVCNALIGSDASNMSFSAIADALFGMNVQLFTVCDGYVFNLLTGDVYYNYTIEGFLHDVEDEYIDNWEYESFDYICGIGMWKPSQIFYNQAKDTQEERGVENFPVYMLEVDIITYGDDGLVITEFDESDLIWGDDGLTFILSEIDRILEGE